MTKSYLTGTISPVLISFAAAATLVGVRRLIRPIYIPLSVFCIYIKNNLFFYSHSHCHPKPKQLLVELQESGEVPCVLGTSCNLDPMES